MRTIRTNLGAAFALAALSASAMATTPGVSSGGSSDATLDCSAAAASQGVIWPPDHTYVPEYVVGVVDPAGSPITVLVTRIEQDEMVVTPGSGHTAPDGTGVGTPTAMVRAERAGPGTGRIYFISFTATNSSGECSGTVPVFVPHDQGQGFVPIDTGLRFDSTQAVF
jgi:hypothetical protein